MLITLVISLAGSLYCTVCITSGEYQYELCIAPHNVLQLFPLGQILRVVLTTLCKMIAKEELRRCKSQQGTTSPVCSQKYEVAERHAGCVLTE